MHKSLVAAKEGKNVLLISRELLDWDQFDDSGNTSWSSSSLRSWLNDEFYYSAFSESERAKIVTTSVNNGQEGVTQDRVFLLSQDQLDTYMGDSSKLSLSGYMTNYGVDHAKERSHGYFDPIMEYEWWTRTPASESGKMVVISAYGNFTSGMADDYRGVRPAIWVTDWAKK